jgi:hypothetical protein
MNALEKALLDAKCVLLDEDEKEICIEAAQDQKNGTGTFYLYVQDDLEQLFPPSLAATYRDLKWTRRSYSSLDELRGYLDILFCGGHYNDVRAWDSAGNEVELDPVHFPKKGDVLDPAPDAVVFTQADLDEWNEIH